MREGPRAGGHGEADTIASSDQAVKEKYKTDYGQRRFAGIYGGTCPAVYSRAHQAVSADRLSGRHGSGASHDGSHLPGRPSALPWTIRPIMRWWAVIWKNGLSETGAVTTVAGIILDYRAFDTFGESVVLFLAAVSVIALLRRKSESGYSGGKTREGNGA